MKKRIFVFALLSSMLLSGCFHKTNTENVDTVTTNLYSLINYKSGDVVDFTNKKGIEFAYKTFKGEELNPYISIATYFSFYKGLFATGYGYDISDRGSIQLISVKGKNNTVYFSCEINTSRGTIIYSGDFASAFSHYPDYSTTTLMTGLNQTGTSLYNGSPDLMTLMNYKSMGYKTIFENDVAYLPLSLFESSFSAASGVHHLFNYHRIVQFVNNEDLEEISYKENNKTYTFNSEMKEYVVNSLNGIMPTYLIEDRQNAFNYIMEYQYGLKKTRGISSMVELLKKQSFYADFSSSDISKRTDALNKTFAFLDDGHSSIRNTSTFAWAYPSSASIYGEHVSQILEVRATLTPLRSNMPVGQVYYSSDEKLAFLSFDSFNIANDAFLEDGKTLKESVYNPLEKEHDTFFYLARKLQEIKEKTGVIDVVIDISINGGGILAALLKIMPLLSKYNNGIAHMSADNGGYVYQYDNKCDSNLDGECNLEDCYGDDFNIYLLTSGFSFSCGNALPFYIKKNDIAPIIGQKSGGGECTVAENYLPSGEHFLHSSGMHMGFYQNAKFEGDEPGTPVDISIEYKDFYDLDKLQQILNNQ